MHLETIKLIERCDYNKKILQLYDIIIIIKMKHDVNKKSQICKKGKKMEYFGHHWEEISHRVNQTNTLVHAQLKMCYKTLIKISAIRRPFHFIPHLFYTNHTNVVLLLTH